MSGARWRALRFMPWSVRAVAHIALPPGSAAAGACGTAVIAAFVSVGSMTATIITTNGDDAFSLEQRQLTTEMLERFRARAGDLDRTNAYFEEDLAELRAIGYLAAAVPAE